MKYNLPEITEFLHQSNLIERVDTQTNDALEAWDVLQGKTVLTHDLILKVHKVLLKNLDLNIAGEYRRHNVRVGSFVAPRFEKVPLLMEGWVQRENRTKLTEESVEELHIAFEQIHPFADGNGRVGRIIMNWQRENAGLPILIIHEGEEQFEYYKLFR